jgi:hypothetical protein
VSGIAQRLEGELPEKAGRASRNDREGALPQHFRENKLQSSSEETVVREKAWCKTLASHTRMLGADTRECVHGGDKESSIPGCLNWRCLLDIPVQISSGCQNPGTM